MNGLEPHQWTALRARLERARADLLRQLADDLDRDADVRVPPPHEAEASPADNASQRTLNALVHETAAHTAQQLSMVRQALAKFDDQGYGLCDNCGGQIGYSRLNARPEARLCIACQTRVERRRR
nr:TraR/DksA family transcriptional regulator [uncultured Duganella sp.]